VPASGRVARGGTGMMMEAAHEAAICSPIGPLVR
jgi:hypothetical protein